MLPRLSEKSRAEHSMQQVLSTNSRLLFVTSPVAVYHDGSVGASTGSSKPTRQPLLLLSAIGASPPRFPPPSLSLSSSLRDSSSLSSVLELDIRSESVPAQQLKFLSHGTLFFLPQQLLEQQACASEDASPIIHRGDITQLALLSVGFLLLFWVANYVVPDLVFKKNILQTMETDDVGVTEDEGPKFEGEKGKLLDALVGTSTVSDSTNSSLNPDVDAVSTDAFQGRSKSSSGFGRARKEFNKARKRKS